MKNYLKMFVQTCHSSCFIWGLNHGLMVWKDCLSQGHGLWVNLYCGYVTFHNAVLCMLLEWKEWTVLNFIFHCHYWQLETLYMSLCVCFMRMFGSCLINVLLSLTHFSLVWYFLSLVSSWLLYGNTIHALKFAINDIKCSDRLCSSISFCLIHIFICHIICLFSVYSYWHMNMSVAVWKCL